MGSEILGFRSAPGEQQSFLVSEIVISAREHCCDCQAAVPLSKCSFLGSISSPLRSTKRTVRSYEPIDSRNLLSFAAPNLSLLIKPTRKMMKECHVFPCLQLHGEDQEHSIGGHPSEAGSKQTKQQTL